MAVYVIAAAESGPVKIGVSMNPIRRLKQLQTASSSALSVFYTYDVGAFDRDVERAAHSSLRNYRSSGEWFTVSVRSADNRLRSVLAELNIPGLIRLGTKAETGRIFREWCRVQAERDDPVGDIASDIIRDKSWPVKARTIEELERYVGAKARCESILSAFDEALFEWNYDAYEAAGVSYFNFLDSRQARWDAITSDI